MTDPRDLARHLPLSNRPRHDESAIAIDWRAELETLTGANPARRRVGPRDYGAALVDAFEAGRSPAARPALSGAAALAQAQRAPGAVRAVIRGRTIRATDAGWEFGAGPALEGTAEQLLRFLYGRGPVPPEV